VGDLRNIGVDFEPAIVMVQALREGGQQFDLGIIKSHFEKWFTSQS